MFATGVGFGTMSARIVRLPSSRASLMTKRQLAAALGRSTRWIEIRMREGLPVLPRQSPQESARFDFDAVQAWIESRGSTTSATLQDRVARLERELARLAATRDEEPS